MTRGDTTVSKTAALKIQELPRNQEELTAEEAGAAKGGVRCANTVYPPMCVNQGDGSGSGYSEGDLAQDAFQAVLGIQ
jgi:hypothetical protein